MSKAVWLLCGVIACVTGACASRAFLIVEYPVYKPAPDAGVEAAAGPDDAGADGGVEDDEAWTRSSRYWSAYARLEARDIPTLWRATRRDYLLISAKVTLPTQRGKIERDFPLFIIEKGQVQRQQGVDLLQKFPLSEAARDQVVVKIEVRFIADKEALDMVRKILDEAATAAKPYLGNFAVGAQILGSAIPLIDRITNTDDIGPSSAAFAVIPAELAAEASTCEQGSSLRAFLLFPFEDEEERQRIGAYKDDLHECRDPSFRGRLCKGAGLYREARVDDVVYLTIEFRPTDDVLDPAILVRGTGSHCALITQGSIEAAQRYLADNAHLFALEDVDAAQSSYQAAADYLSLRQAMRDSDVQELIRHLEQEREGGPQHLRTSSLLGQYGTALENCWQYAWDQTPAVEVWQVWSLYRTVQECDRVASEAALRLDLIHGGLEKLAQLMGRKFSAQSLDLWQGAQSPILELLQSELVRAYKEQDDADYSKAPCADVAAALALAQQVSVHCTSCWKELKAACRAHAGALDAERARRRALIEPMLEHVRLQADGTLKADADEGLAEFPACVAPAAPPGP